MVSRLVEGRNGKIWVDTMPDELGTMNLFDKTALIIFIVSAIASILVMLWFAVSDWLALIDAMPLITAPFLIVGTLTYVHLKKYIQLAAIIAFGIALYILNVDYVVIFFLMFTFIGSLGVVEIVSGLQRYMFYRVVQSVEYLNVKREEDLSLRDKLVAFLFNVPTDIDSREVTCNYNMKRASFPWNEVWRTMTMGFMIGTFLWIYFSMNPMFMDTGTFTEIPLYLFSIILYIPVIIMPWSIFMSMDVRVETKYRAFRLYDGIIGTLKRMTVPILAAFMFVLLAVNKNGFASVLGFIVLSVAINMIIIGFTSILYYMYFESRVVDDVVSKWNIFRPISLTMEISSDNNHACNDVPGTPRRDMTDYGTLIFKDDD